MSLRTPLRSPALLLVLTAGLLGPAQADEIMYCGAARQAAVGDFNDDGRQDLVIGSPE